MCIEWLRLLRCMAKTDAEAEVQHSYLSDVTPRTKCAQAGMLNRRALLLLVSAISSANTASQAVNHIGALRPWQAMDVDAKTVAFLRARARMYIKQRFSCDLSTDSSPTSLYYSPLKTTQHV
jgi:hypothetical protein